MIIIKDEPVNIDELNYQALKTFLEGGQEFWRIVEHFSLKSYAEKSVALAPSGYTGSYLVKGAVYEVTIQKNG